MPSFTTFAVTTAEVKIASLTTRVFLNIVYKDELIIYHGVSTNNWEYIEIHKLEKEPTTKAPIGALCRQLNRPLLVYIFLLRDFSYREFLAHSVAVFFSEQTVITPEISPASQLPDTLWALNALSTLSSNGLLHIFFQSADYTLSRVSYRYDNYRVLCSIFWISDLLAISYICLLIQHFSIFVLHHNNRVFGVFVQKVSN